MRYNIAVHYGTYNFEVPVEVDADQSDWLDTMTTELLNVADEYGCNLEEKLAAITNDLLRQIDYGTRKLVLWIDKMRV